MDSPLGTQLRRRLPQTFLKRSVFVQGAEGFRVRLRRLSEYGSVAPLLKDQHGKHSSKVLGHHARSRGWKGGVGEGLERDWGRVGEGVGEGAGEKLGGLAFYTSIAPAKIITKKVIA